MYKDILGVIAILITFYSFYPYIKSINEGKVKPHYFSWIIWGLTTVIVFFAQLSDGGGAGAWSIGVSGFITFYVAYLSFAKVGRISIKTIDWVFFIAALLSLPVWFLTSDPLWAVVILVTVDVLGFGPTLRKAYHEPHDEQILFYFLFAFRNLISIFALGNISLVTMLFPVVTGIACIILIVIIELRRRLISAS